jgi:hypothetical protein
MINFKNTEQASAVYALIVSALFTFLAFYNTDAETYLFPRIIAIALAILSLILLISNSGIGAKKTEESTEGVNLRDIWPGLLVGLLFLLLLETLGFYMSSFLAFLSILLLYGKRKALDVEAFTIKVVVSSGFMIILFLLFWNGLHVRTPTGWFF